MVATVSIIIPTFNRQESLRRTLSCLGRQTYPSKWLEVIVVDDGSSDNTRAVACASWPFPLQYYYQANRGSAAARNNGAERGSGEVFIFLDDDILVEPDYVAAIAHEHDLRTRAIVVGTFQSYLPPQPTPFQAIYARPKLDQAALGSAYPLHYADLTSNNASMRRSDFFALGMWEDVAGDGPTLWGDVDLAYRAHKEGYTFWRVPKAICYHDDYASRSLAAASNYAEAAGKRAVLLFKKYPDLATDIPMFRDMLPVARHHDSPRLVIRKLVRHAASAVTISKLLELVVSILEQRRPAAFLLRPLYRWIIGAYIFRGYRQGLREFASP